VLKAFIRSSVGQKLVDRIMARAQRTPYFHLYHDDGRLYMERFWLLRFGMPRDAAAIEQRIRRLTILIGNPDFNEAMRRYALRQVATLRELLIPRFGIRVHRIVSSDVPVFHDHPWDNSSLVLRGGYSEITPDWTVGATPAHITVSTDYDGHEPDTYHHVQVRYCGAGARIKRKAGDWHYLVLSHDNEAWTLFFTGSKLQDWGFLVDGLIKVPWRIFLERRAARRDAVHVFFQAIHDTASRSERGITE
jgi:hypothetical protein